MNAFNEKKQARIERYKQYAENARTSANQCHERADQMASIIPPGQPILIGHHSERADRRYRERIHNTMRKGFEESKRADYWEQRAESAESSKAIMADDPEAIDKLETKAETLESLAEEMKRINREFRKLGALDGIEMSEKMRAAATSNMQIWKGQPFPAYALSNLRQRIVTAKKRAEAISRAESFEAFEVNGISVALEEGQIRVRFPYKPNEETRTKLKRSPLALKWSSYSKCWVRKFTGQGQYFATTLKQTIEAARPESALGVA